MADTENSRLDPSEVLITGKAGLIGSRLHGVCYDLKNGDDILDYRRLRIAVRGKKVVIHLAALKNADESIREPLKYWDTNVSGTVSLLQAMAHEGVDRLVFASSAAVHGTTPYGQTKRACELMIQSCTWMKAGILRIFNVVPNALFDCAESGFVQINGNDYQTKDGTCERDYIDVRHVARAINLAAMSDKSFMCDIGTGVKTSVMDVVNKHQSRYVIGPRRDGDIVSSVADIEPAKSILGFVA